MNDMHSMDSAARDHSVDTVRVSPHTGELVDGDALPSGPFVDQVRGAMRRIALEDAERVSRAVGGG